MARNCVAYSAEKAREIGWAQKTVSGSRNLTGPCDRPMGSGSDALLGTEDETFSHFSVAILRLMVFKRIYVV